MTFFIFSKRYIKTPLFFLALISSFLIFFLYEKTDLNLSENLNIGLYSADNFVQSDNLVKRLTNKNSYFKYKQYQDLNLMKKDIQNGNINYGFKIDFAQEMPFTLYGGDEKFSEIAKEDFYSSYFEILSSAYTKNLLKISEDDYENMYNKELERTFKFEYEDENIGKIFPIREISSFFLYVLSLLACYDYFNLSSKTEFFNTFSGRKKYLQFISSAIVINSSIYFILLSVCKNLDILPYIFYNICLFIVNLVFINIFNKKNYLIFMPLITIMSFISIFMNRIDSLKTISYLFINNWYTNFLF